MMQQSYTDFDPLSPFTVIEQPHRGSKKTWHCEDASDFVEKASEYYMHHTSWQEFAAKYEVKTEDG